MKTVDQLELELEPKVADTSSKATKYDCRVSEQYLDDIGWSLYLTGNHSHHLASLAIPTR